MKAWLLVIVLAQVADLTPGRLRTLPLETICTTKWGTDRRAVTEAMKKHVAAAYGIPWADRGQYEFDHLIPRSLGGADDILNLWPQPWPEARRKDRLEVTLGRLVCAGTITLGQAQQAIRTDWRAAYDRFVAGTDRP